MSRLKRKIKPAIVTVVMLGVATALFSYWRYVRHPDIRLADGTVVPGLSIAEVGDLAGDPYRHNQIAYLENLRAYRKLSFTSLASSSDSPSKPTEEAVKSTLFATLSTGQAQTSGKVEEQVPVVVTKKLVDHWTLLLQRAGGLSTTEFERQLPRGMTCVIPANSSLLEATIRDYCPDTILPKPSDASGCHKLFKTLGSLATTSGYTDGQIEGLSLDPSGFAVAVSWTSTEYPDPEPLTTTFGSELDKFFVGGLSQAQLVMHKPDRDWDEMKSRASKAWVAQLLIIVRTRSGDCYPVGFTSYYDSSGNAWYLLKAVREVSLPMLRTPPLVF